MSFSEKISPAEVSIANIPPGDSLPLETIFFSLIGFTPVSEAIVMLLNLSI